MRNAFALLTALALASASAPAVAAGGPYKLDSGGKCRDGKGAFASMAMCKGATPAAGARCTDPKTKKFVKCGTPGAAPMAAAKSKPAAAKP